MVLMELLLKYLYQQKKMNWYKKAQNVPDEVPAYGYHATNPEHLEQIRASGLPPKSFFADKEEDTSPFADGLWLRFELKDVKYEKLSAALGGYYKAIHGVPAEKLEFKIDIWDDYQPLL